MAKGMTGKNVGVGGYATAKIPATLPEGVTAKHVQPHATVTKPNGMGRLAGGPRGHRELPKPIIPTPTQGRRKVS